MYILVTGAPGSRWSGVITNIYQSADIDQTDSSFNRQYASGVVKHTGAYFDPGMEFDNSIDQWDKPFSGLGKRIIRSHTFAHRLLQLSNLGYPIVMVYRNDYECFDWWCQAGGFDITYPDYKPYYQDLDNMWTQIKLQNNCIMEFVKKHSKHIRTVDNNEELCNTLDIAVPKHNIVQQYSSQDTKVYVYKR